MIKTQRGNTNIEFYFVEEMMADYACITKSVVESLQEEGCTEEEAWEEISEAIEMAKLPEDELEARAKEGIRNFLKELRGDSKKELEEEE